jgi:hypothetical protein
LLACIRDLIKLPNGTLNKRTNCRKACAGEKHLNLQPYATAFSVLTEKQNESKQSLLRDRKKAADMLC